MVQLALLDIAKIRAVQRTRGPGPKPGKPPGRPVASGMRIRDPASQPRAVPWAIRALVRQHEARAATTGNEAVWQRCAQCAHLRSCAAATVARTC